MYGTTRVETLMKTSHRADSDGYSSSASGPREQGPTSAAQHAQHLQQDQEDHNFVNTWSHGIGLIIMGQKNLLPYTHMSCSDGGGIILLWMEGGSVVTKM